MYKVFINEVPVFFTEKHINNLRGFKSVDYQKLDLKNIVEDVHSNSKAKVNVICDNLENDWNNFMLNFQVRKAAGGVVKNNNSEILWIYRFGKWDLPKGHIEKNESKTTAAIREVTEECNVSDLTIDKELQTTYHVFKHNDILVMKITYWFSMTTKEINFNLIPQKEEGITKVVFMSASESEKALENTYENIKLLLNPIL